MPLYDPHKRLIDYLRISVTDRCNLSCFYCKPRTGMKMLPHSEILSYEEILRLVALAVPLGISRVRVTGGEPLVRRGIIDFMASLHSLARHRGHQHYHERRSARGNGGRPDQGRETAAQYQP